MKTRFVMAALVASIGVASAAEAATLSERGFNQRIENIVSTTGASYAWATFRNGAVSASGASGYANDAGQLAMSIDNRTPLLSMSKTVTAAGFLKFLDSPDAHLEGCRDPLDCLIEPYLPSSWVRGQNVDKITFRMLLSHRSGLTNPSGSWDDCRASIAQGVPILQLGVENYENINFTLPRVLMAYVHDKTAMHLLETLGLAPSFTAAYFRDWIVEHVFAPLGITDVDLGPDPTAAYRLALYDVNHSNVWHPPADGSALLTGGAGSWNMSLRNFGSFLESLRNGTTLTSSEWSRLLDPYADGAWGLGMKHNIKGNYGVYPAKGGSIGVGNGRGACGMWMMYPDGVAAVWYINQLDGMSNCPVADGASAMRDAYDDSMY